MGRSILAVIAGYVAMGVFVMATFTVMYLLLGADRAYQPGTYEVSLTWTAGALVLGFVAALLGGYVCAWIAKRPKPPLVLAGLALVLGLISAAFVVAGPRPDPLPRGPDVGFFESTQNARQPAWFALINPLIACAGVVAGARLRKTA